MMVGKGAESRDGGPTASIRSIMPLASPSVPAKRAAVSRVLEGLKLMACLKAAPDESQSVVLHLTKETWPPASLSLLVSASPSSSCMSAMVM